MRLTQSQFSVRRLMVIVGAMRLRFTVRRMMMTSAIAAVALAVLKSLEPRQSFIPLPRTYDVVMLELPMPVGMDGRGGTYTPAERTALVARMTAPEVLDTAVVDPRIGRLPLFANSTSPRALLARCFAIADVISMAETGAHPAIDIVLLCVSCPAAVADVTDAVADAIVRSGPRGVTIYGRPTGLSYPCRVVPIPWQRDWRVCVIALVSFSAALLALKEPGGRSPPYLRASRR